MRKPILPLFLAIFLLAPLLALASPPGKWIEIRSPNFVIVSNAEQVQALDTATQLEQIRALFLGSIPGVKASASSVVTILATRDEDSFKLLMPEYQFAPKATNIGSLYISGYNLHQVAINLLAKGLNPYEGVYHDYYHLLMEPHPQGLPTWVSEGLADFYGNTEIHNKTATLGMPSHNLIDLLHTNKLIPLDTLFKVDHSSSYYNERNRDSIFYAEAWALVHYLVLGDKRAHNAALENYLGALERGASPDEAAKALGDPTVLLLDLQRYIRGMPIPAVEEPAPAKPSSEEFHVRVLSGAEVDAYSGGFLALHSQYKEAEPLLKDAVKLDPKLALALRNLALLQYFRQENKDALASAAAAIALDPQDVTARYLRADLTFEGAAHDDPQIETDLRQALAISPDFAAADALLALYLVAANDNLPEAVTLGQKAVSLEPEDNSLQMALAQVFLAMKRYDEAEAMGKRAQANTTDNGARSQIDQFLSFVSDARKRDPLGVAPEINTGASASTNTTQEVPPKPNYSTGEGVEGIITQVLCDKAEMQITVKVDDNTAPMVFHAKDRTTVIYATALPQVHAGIEPCTELEGRTARITFSAPASKLVQGELVEIELTK